MLLLRVGHPDRIHWKSFLRIAAPLAAVVGFFAAYSPLLAWLVLLPASVVFAIHFYRRRQPGPLKIAQGAKLGALISLLNFALFAVFLVVTVVHDPVAYRQGAEKTLQDAVAHNPNPQAEQMAKAMISSPGGIAFFTVVGMAFLLVFLLAIGSASGALAAALSRDKSGP